MWVKQEVHGKSGYYNDETRWAVYKDELWFIAKNVADQLARR